MPLLRSFAPEHEIVTLAWIGNASVQFLLNIYPIKGKILPLRICQIPELDLEVDLGL